MANRLGWSRWAAAKASHTYKSARGASFSTRRVLGCCPWVVDINQPVDREKGTLKSINRLAACVPTVKELADKGAKVVLLAHQGSDIEYKNYYTTRPRGGRGPP